MENDSDDMFVDMDLDELIKEAMKDPVVAASARENDFRRTLSILIRLHSEKQGIDLNKLAKELFIPKSQLRRLLHDEVGGRLELISVFKIVEALGIGLHLVINLKTSASQFHSHT